MNSKIKSLPEAFPVIDALEADLTAAGVELPSKPALKTLTVARDHISKLEALRPKKESALARTESPTALKRPASPWATPTVADIKNVVASLPSLESVQEALNAAQSSEARLHVLTSASTNYLNAASDARTKRDFAAERQHLQARARIERKLAHELASAPEGFKAALRRYMQSQVPI